MSKFKDEEVVILRELGYRINLLEISIAHLETFSVLEFVSGAYEDSMHRIICGCAKYEKYMKNLIDLSDNFSNAITSVANGLEVSVSSVFTTFHTERTLRRLIDADNPENRSKHYILSCVVTNNFRAKRKNAIQFVLDSEPGIHDLRYSLKIAYKKYVENTFVYNMIIEAF